MMFVSSRFFHAAFCCFLLASLCTADYGVSVYSDAQCTIPSALLPSFLNTATSVAVNSSQCVPASTFPTPWIPSPGVPQWVAYSCGSGLTVATFDYSSSANACPFPNFTFTTQQANSSALFATASQRCRVIEYNVYNSATGLLTSSYLYGNFSCTSQASNAGSSSSSISHLLLCLLPMLISLWLWPL